MYQIAAKLRHMRRPKSQVECDLPPRLVTEYADILAIPLKHIFDLIAETLEWPDTLKDELVTLFPKVPIPSLMSELRNLSCTPFCSKVLESFILERLRWGNNSVEGTIWRSEGNQCNPFHHFRATRSYGGHGDIEYCAESYVGGL